MRDGRPSASISRMCTDDSQQNTNWPQMHAIQDGRALVDEVVA